MNKLIRITTVPVSLEKLLEGQLSYMANHYAVTAVSSEKVRLEMFGIKNGVATFHVEMTRTITPAKDLKALLKLYNFFKKEKPLIVHSHTPKAGIIGMLAGKMAGVPIRLHTVAGLPLLETTGVKRKILNTVETFTYKFATRVYPNSFELKRIILKSGYAKDVKLKVLGKGSSNGIDTTFFDSKNFEHEELIYVKKELGIPENDFIYIFVGRLVSEKGINELVKTFLRIQEDQQDVSLLLVGPYEQELDPLEDEVVHLIKSSNKIFTPGYQQDVRPYFAISDTLVFPSYREGFPNVVMQANAMGLPAIVTNINGCNEIIKDEINGLIISVKDEDDLENSMRRVYNDAALRNKMASAAREFIQRDYERFSFWQDLLKEYKELEALHKHA